MSDARLANRLTVQQLLDSLRDRVTSILFVDFSPVTQMKKLTVHKREQTY